MDFKTGDEVEVCSDDEGFRGAWYEAKIVRSMPRLNRYTVVYDSIVEETDASRNLRETVDAAYVRPRPIFARDGVFAIQQPVDAFCNDGWWEGVVSGLLGSVRRAKYSVSFPSTGDVMEFLPSELRPHLDWVNGEWVDPQTQVSSVPGVCSTEDMSGKMFQKGTSVEVSSDAEGFHGAWFPATVVKSVRNKFLVEYRDLTTDDETEPLKETVDSLHIRPTPPAILPPAKFKYLEEVDAYYNDGWWVGVISKVIDDSNYIVYFRTWGQEIEFRYEDLRPHHDWISGRWFRASQILSFY
ncbi:DUF724 domain-containing protein 3 isoform X2 [Dendrobium catenatum]|uniref:Agenet domain-containing protein n=1 Tax=Dendrobium catenatum TaxID=906689 RepID=A0A2I0W9Q1_9ASPA|nr:DUF724 domain-containing protein 3 isoform X2 [Dendrobium catenatum]PKU72383.1 hypothetical protein MA16_Dca025586 [Dendrobium catenatum]